MVSLRRMISLDSISNTSSSSASSCNAHIIRHSSLPSHFFLGQPEYTIGALRILSRCHRGASLCTRECPSFQTPPKCTLCRATFANRSFDDEFPDFEAPKGFLQSNHGRHFLQAYADERRECAPYGSRRKEAMVADQGLDSEKSVVYSEMRKSMCRLEAPSRYFKPYDTLAKVSAGAGTPTLAVCHATAMPDERKSQNISDLLTRDDAKTRPMSLRMLGRKLPKKPVSDKAAQRRDGTRGALESASRHFGASGRSQFDVMGFGDSVCSAFASLVYMLKTLQQHALSSHMRVNASAAVDVGHETWPCAEMADTLLWLFQQVFSRTPKLMLLTMMLLADFTLHSMSKHVVFPVMYAGEPPTVGTFPSNVGFEEVLPSSEDEGGGGVGGGVARAIRHGESHSDGIENWLSLRNGSLQDKAGPVHGADCIGTLGTSSSRSPPSSSPLLPHAHHIQEIQGAQLDSEMKMLLVAPVHAPPLEMDDYPCFDRTDLTYQHEISMDPGNPLLLANYAQFLHVVRHNYSRAEGFYRKAATAERDVDGEVMARYANFLWVVKGDLAEAEMAFKAAAEADPTNVYHAGYYANFLWSSGACQAEETSCACIINNSTTISEEMPTS